MPSFEDPQAYLSQHLEKEVTSKQEVAGVEEYDQPNNPIREHILNWHRNRQLRAKARRYDQEHPGEGVVDLYEGDVDIHAEFFPVDLSTIPPEWVEMLDGPAYLRARNPERWREMCAYTINLDDRFILDVFSLLPEGTRIFFTHLLPDEPSVADVKDKMIFLRGDLRKSKTLLICLHEIGHLYAEPTKPEDRNEAINTSLPINPEAAARFLKNERDAWAFATWKARSLVTEDGWLTNEILEDTVHGDHGLANYSATLRRHLKDIPVGGSDTTT